MMNYENENLEFERINEKLDRLFDIVSLLVAEQKREEFDRQLKEKRDKAECAEKEVQWHLENRRYLEESNEWMHKDWNSINDHYHRMKGEDRIFPVERQDVPGGF